MEGVRLVSVFTDDQAAALGELSAHFADTPPVVIGAVGLGCHLPMTWRRTNDLDLTLAVDLPALGRITRLPGWKRDERLPYRFLSPGGLRVDLLPSCAELLERGELVFADTGQVMNLVGFDLALRHNVAFQLAHGASIHVATVPVIAVLKMAAFLDRPEARERDLHDLCIAFEEYVAPDDERRWTPPLLECGLDFADVAAFALGHDLGGIAGPTHRSLVGRFLSAVAVDSHAFARMRQFVNGHADEREERLIGRLAAFRQGLLTAVDSQHEPAGS